MPLPAARELGFAMAGVVTDGENGHKVLSRRWLKAGLHGKMAYLARPDAIRRRESLDRTLSGVQSALVVAQLYGDGQPNPHPRPLPRAPAASARPGSTALAPPLSHHAHSPAGARAPAEARQVIAAERRALVGPDTGARPGMGRSRSGPSRRPLRRLHTPEEGGGDMGLEDGG